MPEAGTHRTEKGLDEVIAGTVAFTVDKLDEQLALTIGELLHAWRVLLPDGRLYAFHVLVLGLLVGQCLEVITGLDDDAIDFLGNGQHFLHIVDQAVEGSTLLGVLETG